MNLKTIAVIYNGYSEKFGIPRQSGLVEDVISKIVFESEFSDENAFRGIEEFSHLWLIWGFSKANKSNWSPTVRPPRLGGNKRVGVFATRSPYRPNKIGLSSVKLVSVKKENSKTVLYVSGADLLDGTPIYDIKPYLTFTDSHPNAVSGFAETTKDYSIEVIIPEEIKNKITDFYEVEAILKNDPRPSYIDDSSRIYGIEYKEQNIKFKVADNILTVIDVEAKRPTE